MKYTHKDGLVDGKYRYLLSRVWGGGNDETYVDHDEAKVCVFVLLNPSMADAQDDDPTLERCAGFADRWGYNVLHIINLFAYRTPYPAKLFKAEEPVGRGTLQTMTMAVQSADMVVCAWGGLVGRQTIKKHAEHFDKVRRLLEALPMFGVSGPMCLGRTKDGAPKHPLYLPEDTEPELFTFEGWEAMQGGK